MLWVRKYAPKRLSDIIGQDHALPVLRRWIKNPSKPLLVYGPPGIGKTACAYALANEYNLELIEVNASDFRDKQSLQERVVNAAMQASLFGKNKLILIDEVDGLSSRDKGAISALLKLFQISRYPIYLTCNDPWADAIRLLRPHVELLEFKKPRISEIVKLLEKICENEGIECDRKVLYALAQDRDVRSAIMDLEAIAKGKKKITEEDLAVLGARDREKTIFDALLAIFKGRSIWAAKLALAGLDMELDEVFYWLDENIPKEYEQAEEITKAFNYLSRADVFKGRIVRRQDWGLFAFASDLATIGVAFSKARTYKKFTKYAPPGWLKILGLTKQKRQVLRELLTKIGRYTHTSREVAFSYIPVLYGMLKQKAQLPFEISEEEQKLIAELASRA